MANLKVRWHECMKKSAIIFSAANLIGLLLCLVFVVCISQQAKLEQRNYYDFGDSLNIILMALPIFILCFLLNVFWGIKALVEIFRRRDYQSALACVVVMGIWMVAILILRQIT